MKCPIEYPHTWNTQNLSIEQVTYFTFNNIEFATIIYFISDVSTNLY